MGFSWRDHVPKTQYLREQEFHVYSLKAETPRFLYYILCMDSSRIPKGHSPWRTVTMTAQAKTSSSVISGLLGMDTNTWEIVDTGWYTRRQGEQGGSYTLRKALILPAFLKKIIKGAVYPVFARSEKEAWIKVVEQSVQLLFYQLVCVKCNTFNLIEV